MARWLPLRLGVSNFEGTSQTFDMPGPAPRPQLRSDVGPPRARTLASTPRHYHRQCILLLFLTRMKAPPLVLLKDVLLTCASGRPGVVRPFVRRPTWMDEGGRKGSGHCRRSRARSRGAKFWKARGSKCGIRWSLATAGSLQYCSPKFIG